MASEHEPLSEESSGSSCWSPPSAESSSIEGSQSAGHKLFIFNLARTVTDADLAPLFAPFSPTYACVAIGKKGTSRRFGFAKFADQASAAAALEALRGTQLHGKQLDLKFAVALEDPDPSSGVQPKMRAKLRAAAAQDASPRIAARQLPLSHPRPAFPAAAAPDAAKPAAAHPLPLPLLPATAVAAVPNSTTPPLPAEIAAPTGAPAAAAPVEAVPVQLPDAPAPMQHMLVVPHGPGLSHDSIIQLAWCFRPMNVSTSMDASGVEKSSVLFATLQQAHAAQDAVCQRGAAEGYMPATSLVSIPLHGGAQAHMQVAAPLPMPLPVPVPLPGLAKCPPQPQHAMQPLPAPAVPQAPPAMRPQVQARPPLQPAAVEVAPAVPAAPPAPVQQQQQQQGPALQHQMPTVQQQREAVTMRPLYAGPRPAHLRPMHMLPPGYHPAYHPPWAPMPGQHPRPAPVPAPAPGTMHMCPPGPPPYHFLNPAAGPWVPPESCQPPTTAASAPRPAAQPMPALPDTLLSADGPPSPKRLNPAAAAFSPTKPGRPAAAGVAPPAPQPAQAPAHALGGGPPVVMPPVIHSIFSNIEAALAGRSFVPAWDRQQDPGQPLVVAEAIEYDSGTEDEGEEEPEPREVFAAVNTWNLNTCFVTRSLMRKLAPVEVLLKQTAVGDDPEAAPSVLIGAVVRLLVDKSYKLRQVQGTYVKPETGRLMLVLHDISSPIPAEHISNTCPLGLGSITPAAETELLELQAKLAFHGRRLYRHEVAATAWHLQFAEHWQRENSGKTGDELRLATSHLRAMLGDEDEIRWRRRGVHGLDLAQETAAISSAFRLPWTAAANWMNQRSPNAKLLPAFCPGGSPGSAEQSSQTGEYETRAQFGAHEVLGLQVGIHMAPSRSACRSLQRSIADTQHHDAYMAAALAGSQPYHQAAFAGSQMPAQPGTGLTVPLDSRAEQPAIASRPATAASSGASSGASSESLAASLDAELDPEQNEEDRLLAEAATFGAAEGGADWPPLPEFFNAGCHISAAAAGTGPGGRAASPKRISTAPLAGSPPKHAGGNENSNRQASTGSPGANRATTKGAQASATNRADSNPIPVVHFRS